MKPSNFTKYLGYPLGLLALVVGFQNCSPAFRPLSESDSSSNSSASGPNGTSGLPISSPADPRNAAVSLFKSFPDIAVAGKCTTATLRGSSRESVRKLTRVQLTRTLQATFPSLFPYYNPTQTKTSYNDIDAVYNSNQKLMETYPNDVSDDPTENFNPLHLDSQISAWADIADNVGGQVASSGEAQNYGGACIMAATITPACWTGFLNKLGQSLYRRPLTSAEVTQLLTEIPAGSSANAIQTMVSRLLRSPNTVFIIESGVADASGRFRLNNYEVATRLSFDLTDGPPDATLLAAAASGSLQTLAQVQAQAQRLVMTDFAKARFRAFVWDWMRMYKITDGSDSVGGYLQMNYNSFQTGPAAIREINNYVNYEVFLKSGNFNDLMTAAIAFPTEDRTSVPYNTGMTTPNVPLSTPDHPGLLTRIGFLFSSAEESSPILRGVNVIRRVQCTNLPSPDFTIVAQRNSALGQQDPFHQANWQMTQAATSPSTCMACHSIINPVGFVFEKYDSLGHVQDKDYYIHNDGSTGPQIRATFPLPGPQTSSAIIPGVATTYSDPNSMINDIGQSTNARSCMATRFFRAIQKRPEITESDACLLKDAVDLLKQNKPLTDVFIQLIANEDIFWRKGQ